MDAKPHVLLMKHPGVVEHPAGKKSALAARADRLSIEVTGKSRCNKEEKELSPISLAKTNYPRTIRFHKGFNQTLKHIIRGGGKSGGSAEGTEAATSKNAVGS